MGKAKFYAKFYFYTEKEAKRSIIPLKKFLIEGRKAFVFWLRHRYEKKPSVFWTKFKDQFPWISRYLDEIEILGTSDINPGLANYLNFGFNRPLYEVSIKEEPNLFQERNIIYYESWDWQFGDFDPWGEFLKDQFKISFFEWCNDSSDLPQRCSMLKRKYLNLVKQPRGGEADP